MSSVGIITVGYLALVGLTGFFIALGCIVPAIIVGLGALGLMMRYEIRWTLDHTRLTKHQPRPVPKRPVDSLRIGR